MSDQSTCHIKPPMTFQQIMQFRKQRGKIEAPFVEKINNMIFSSKEEADRIITEIEAAQDVAVYTFVKQTYGEEAVKFIKLLDEISGSHLDSSMLTLEKEAELDQRTFEFMKKCYGEHDANLFKVGYLAVDRDFPEFDSVNQATGGTGHIAEAIREGQIAKVIELLDQGVSPYANCSGPLKPLHWAAWHNKVEIIELLLAKGVPVEQQSDDTRTAMSLAALYCSEDAVRVLHAHGANVNHQDEDGETPLHDACFTMGGGLKQAISMVQLLLELGADPTIKNAGNRNALEETLNPPADIINKPREWRLAIAQVLEEAIAARGAKKDKLSSLIPKLTR